MRFLLVLFLVFHNLFCVGQTNYGFYGGLSINLGNEQTRIGIIGGGYINHDYVQLNVKAGGYYNLKSIGIGSKAPEGILGIGLVGAYGPKDSTKIMFNTLLDNNTFRKHSLGYAWNYYWDGQNTSQATGTIMLVFDKIQVATENDLFGWVRGYEDKYRTGAIRVSYQYDNWEFAWKHILYTGDLDENNAVTNTNYPACFGYYSDENSTYSDKSHGISALEVKYKLPYQQVLVSCVGVDSEWIRHCIQNEFMHDLLNKKITKYPNSHIPMVAGNGSQYLFLENQKVKPTTIYYNLGMNTPLFY